MDTAGDVLKMQDAHKIETRREVGGSPSPAGHPGAKILVVDDEPEIVLALTIRLKGAGYAVVAAGDGIEATKQAVHEKPDLIIMDIGMPCGDGHTIASRLAKNTETAAVPIIFLTAATEPKDRMQALSVNAFDYITKPFDSDRLLGSVDRALSGYKSFYDSHKY